MADPFIGEIKMVGFGYAPYGWAQCDGQIIDIRQNAALFSLLGTTFGGDGSSTFGLPDMRGRSPVHPGGDIVQGGRYGVEAVTITQATMAQHTHTFNGDTNTGTTPGEENDVYANAIWGSTKDPAHIYNAPNNLVVLNTGTCTMTGGGQPHNNLQPSLVVLFAIALTGTYPMRN